MKPALSPYGFIPTDSSDLLRRATGGLPGSSPTPTISPRLSRLIFFPLPSIPQQIKLAPAAQRQAAPARPRPGTKGTLRRRREATRECRVQVLQGTPLLLSVAPPGDALPSYCGSTSMAASSVGRDLFRLNDTSTSTNIASSS